MSKNRNRYREMERNMLFALLIDAALFVLYLVVAGLGIIWLKVLLTTLIILFSLFCLGCLYLSKEILRPRSLWMTVGTVGIIVCLFFSLVLNYPSPNPYKDAGNGTTTTTEK